MIHGFLGLSWYIQTNAIGIVILNKKIPINQKAGICSPNKRKGNDKINDQIQIFIHQYLSAIIHQNAFQSVIAKVNHKTIEIQTFQE